MALRFSSGAAPSGGAAALLGSALKAHGPPPSRGGGGGLRFSTPRSLGDRFAGRARAAPVASAPKHPVIKAGAAADDAAKRVETLEGQAEPIEPKGKEEEDSGSDSDDDDDDDAFGNYRDVPFHGHVALSQYPSTVCILGQQGSGKSTLALSLVATLGSATKSNGKPVMDQLLVISSSGDWASCGDARMTQYDDTKLRALIAEQEAHVDAKRVPPHTVVVFDDADTAYQKVAADAKSGLHQLMAKYRHVNCTVIFCAPLYNQFGKNIYENCQFKHYAKMHPHEVRLCWQFGRLDNITLQKFESYLAKVDEINNEHMAEAREQGREKAGKVSLLVSDPYAKRRGADKSYSVVTLQVPFRVKFNCPAPKAQTESAAAQAVPPPDQRGRDAFIAGGALLDDE